MNFRESSESLAKGCAHGTVVKVPCVGCIESEMRSLVSEARSEMHGQLKEEWARMQKDRDDAMQLADQLKKAAELLVVKNQKAQADITELRKRLAETQAALDDKRLSAHAEQAIKTDSKLRLKIEKAAARA